MGKPSANEVSLMQRLCRYIEAHCSEVLTLGHLSNQVHLSASHLQRRFKAVIGVSPREYVESCRLRQLKKGLRTNRSVTEELYKVGFSGPSKVYGRANSRFGMTPRQYRDHGAGLSISYGFAHTSLGLIIIAATDRGVCFIEMGSSRAALIKNLQLEFSAATIAPMTKQHAHQFKRWEAALAGYLEGDKRAFNLPLDIQGTAFQLKVWKYLQAIPHGTVRSYQQVARGIGMPKATRAVANACGRNNVMIVIPCHRVLRGTGGLGGYRGGVAIKRKLLEIEGVKTL